MVSTFTPNIQLEEPARGDQVGTWDTPVNNNETLTDLVVGGITTISLNNSPVILAAAQFQSKGITFNSTLTGSCAITFPTSFKKSYEIFNTCTGSSAFVITLATTAAGGQAICCPPGEIIDCVNDGTNIKFKNFGRIGSYVDYAGSSNPAWNSGCTVPPLLDCNGTTFSATTYPALAVILGSTTLPDFRGRAPFYLNEGTGRLTSAGAGIDGNTLFAAGGNNGITLGASHIPTHTAPVTVASTVAGKLNFPVTAGQIAPQPSPSTGGNNVPFSNAGAGDWATAAGMTGTAPFTNSSQAVVPSPIPGIVSGIRMIRAG